MAEIDYVTALGRLLSNPELRLDFCEDPRQTAARMHVRKSDFAIIANLDARDLLVQARVLYQKRMHELAKAVAETWALLAPRAHEVFERYARSNVGQGTSGICDAIAFLRYLQSLKIPVSEMELHRLVFEQQRRWFSFRLGRIRCPDGRCRVGCHVLCRAFGSMRGWFFQLGLT